MKRVFLNRALLSVAVGLLGTALTPLGGVWAAEEIQILRQSINAGGKVPAAMAFTTFQAEELALTNALPCKWISKDGRLGPSYGGQRYDFLCKGGDFATVSLFMTKSGGDGIGSVKLLYREWAEAANPNAGEARTAQMFLAHVVGRFVPASKAAAVMDAFWGKGSGSWSDGGVKITFGIDKTSDRGTAYFVRRLEVVGNGRRVTPQLVEVAPVGAAPAYVAPVAVPDTGLTKPVEMMTQPTIPGVAPMVLPPVTPTEAGLVKVAPVTAPMVEPKPVMPYVEPKPVVVAPTGLLPMPGMGVGKVGPLVVPVNAPAGGVEPAKPEDAVKPEVEGTLEKATPADLNTAPAPESKATPEAPPEISASLVPTAADLKIGARTKAPSNFDAYNRAVELTKSVEERAQTTRVEDAKVTASKEAKPASAAQLVTPSTVMVPPLKPVLTPEIGEGNNVPSTPANTVGEGLAKAPALTVDEVGQPENYQGPRQSEPRPLPQLKFVPKAEPLKSGDEVIQFEDEKSRI